MARSDGYNTRTRQLILDYLINNCQHAVSASNSLEHLAAQGARPRPPAFHPPPPHGCRLLPPPPL